MADIPVATSWRLILETALDGVVVMDSSGNVVDWNDNSASIFGWTRDEVVGRPMADFIIPQSLRSAHERGLRRYLQSGEAKILGRRIEITALRRSGEEFPVELSITPISKDAKPLFLGFLRDVSDRRIAERLREEHARSLEIEVEERRKAEAQQRLLLAEVNHRVKNMLSVVAAIASQTGKYSPSIEAFRHSFSQRLNTLSAAHSLITSRNWEATPLSELAGQVLSPFETSPERLQIHGPLVLIPAKVVLGVSMVLHEIVTNALKFGALGKPTGQVVLTWTVAENPTHTVKIQWRESGAGPINAPTRSGFGSTMIRAIVQHDLKGNMNIVYGSDGFEYDFQFPLNQPQ